MKNIYRIPTLVVVLATLLLPASGYSQWSTNPDANNAICTVTGPQSSPTIVSDGAGGAIITWQDCRGSDYDIYAQRIDASGNVKWTPSGGIAICTATGNQSSPMIVSDSSGGAIITWQDHRGSDWDIYAQRIDASGNVKWTPSGGIAICTASDNQMYPAIVGDDSGGAIITWQDDRGGSYNDIYAQRIDASGNVKWTPTDGVAICMVTDNQINPTIVSDGSGGAIIMWQDYRSGPVQFYAQRVDGSGNLKWTPTGGVAIFTLSSGASSPTMASDGSGGATITWSDTRTDNGNIYAQLINATGTVQWTANGVAICTAAHDQDSPTIAGDGSGGAIITWYDFRNGTDYDIYAQRVRSDSTKLWTPNGVAICTATGSQESPMIVSDGSGGAIITWMDYRSGGYADIYAQRIDVSGSVQWTANGVAICTAANNQEYLTIVSDGSAGAIITWQDYRNGSDWNIYAERVASYGYLEDPAPHIAAIKDVSNDQGGKIRVMWDPSYLDEWPNTTVRSYNLWMGTKTTGVVGNIGSTTAHLSRKAGPPERTTSSGIYWQSAGSVAAHWLSGYSCVVSTYADSGLQGIPMYYFQVTAQAADSTIFWTSNVDSGYSVDNIPPDPPSSVSGNVVSGAVDMKWKKNKEPDFWRYAIYRSTSSITDPSQLTPLATTDDTTFADSHPITGSRSYYAVCAQDIHGNLSAGSNQISFIPSDFTLSVSVISFTASALDYGVELDWKTGSETNNAGFIVMREMEGDQSFKEIASYTSDVALKGLGTSTNGKSYSYTDNSIQAAGKYTYELENVTTDGVIHPYTQVTIDVSTPTEFALFQNYPNPFNPNTTISFNLKEQSDVTLTIYNMLGQQVAIYNYGMLGAGRYQEEINMERFTSGVYHYRLDASGGDGQKFVSIKKLVLMK